MHSKMVERQKPSVCYWFSFCQKQRKNLYGYLDEMKKSITVVGHFYSFFWGFKTLVYQTPPKNVVDTRQRVTDTVRKTWCDLMRQSSTLYRQSRNNLKALTSYRTRKHTSLQHQFDTLEDFFYNKLQLPFYNIKFTARLLYCWFFAHSRIWNLYNTHHAIFIVLHLQ